jgi:hypothetical protein
MCQYRQATIGDSRSVRGIGGNTAGLPVTNVAGQGSKGPYKEGVARTASTVHQICTRSRGQMQTMPATSGRPAKLAGECPVTAEDRVRTRAFQAGGAVRSRSHLHAGLDGEELGVSSENGIVTLTGTVRSWAGRDAAVAAAWGALGVTDVRDRLTFSY